MLIWAQLLQPTVLDALVWPPIDEVNASIVQELKVLRPVHVNVQAFGEMLVRVHHRRFLN